MGLNSPNEGNFYSTEKIRDRVIPKNVSDTTHFRFNMLLDNQEGFYERTVYSFLDLTGQVGGIFELIVITSAFVFGSISNKYFHFEVYSQMEKHKKIDSQTITTYQNTMTASKSHVNKATTKVEPIPMMSEEVKLDQHQSNKINFHHMETSLNKNYDQRQTNLNDNNKLGKSVGMVTSYYESRDASRPDNHTFLGKIPKFSHRDYFYQLFC